MICLSNYTNAFVAEISITFSFEVGPTVDVVTSMKLRMIKQICIN